MDGGEHRHLLTRGLGIVLAYTGCVASIVSSLAVVGVSLESGRSNLELLVPPWEWRQEGGRLLPLSQAIYGLIWGHTYFVPPTYILYKKSVNSLQKMVHSIVLGAPHLSAVPMQFRSMT